MLREAQLNDFGVSTLRMTWVCFFLLGLERPIPCTSSQQQLHLSVYVLLNLIIAQLKPVPQLGCVEARYMFIQEQQTPCASRPRVQGRPLLTTSVSVTQLLRLCFAMPINWFSLGTKSQHRAPISHPNHQIPRSTTCSRITHTASLL